MRRSLSLLCFLAASLQSIGQTEAETTHEGRVGHKILIEHGIASHCFTITSTPQGVFVGGRDNSNSPINYLYTPDSLFKKIDVLNGYIIFDFSLEKNELLLAKHMRGHIESMCREIFTYNLDSKKFLRQFDLGWIYGSPKYSTYYDSIVVVVMRKNPDGIGSDYVTKTLKAK